jgi:hypothetical protein
MEIKAFILLKDSRVQVIYEEACTENRPILDAKRNHSDANFL